MVRPYRNKRFVKGLIRKIIRFCEKKMREAWCKITEECSEEEEWPAEDLDDMILPDDVTYWDAMDESNFEHKGIACVEAAGVVMKHLDDTERSNKGLYALMKAYEMEQYHEAQKHGMLMAMRTGDEFQKRADELNSKSYEKPRYKKRYGICREHFKKRMEKAGLFRSNDSN